MMSLWLLDGNKERHVASAIHGIDPLHPFLMKLLTMLLVNGVVAKLLTQMLASLTFHALRLATSHFYTQLPLRLLAGQSSIFMATLSSMGCIRMFCLCRKPSFSQRHCAVQLTGLILYRNLKMPSRTMSTLSVA